MLGSSVRATPSNTLVSTQARDVPDDIHLSLGDDKDIVLLNRSSTLTANTALTGVLEGTPVTPALAANSLIISNITNDGDILIAVNDGGNSKAAFWVDASVSKLHTYMDFQIKSANLEIKGDAKAIAVGAAAGGDFMMRYTTEDANAAIPHFYARKSTANDVPVFVFSDLTGLKDLGWFDGITEPRIAIVDDDADSWVGLGFNADDDARVMLGGSASTLTLPATTIGGDILFNTSSRIKTISKTIDHADLTDGSDATAYADFGEAVPAGSIVIGVAIDFSEAFNSDDTTTLTLQIGDDGGTDSDQLNLTASGEDIFNTTTDVFWGESSCQNAVVTSSTTFRLLFTEDDDGTDIINSTNAQGALTCKITYITP